MSTPLLEVRTKRAFGGSEYDISRFVARGNSGDVYVASDGRLDYALKVFFPYYALENKAAAPDIDIARLIGRVAQMQLHEHDTLKSIEHPNIVRVYGIGTVDLNDAELAAINGRYKIDIPRQLPAVLIQYITGWNFAEALAGKHIDRVEDIAYALEKIAAALKYLHTHKQFLHADIRPENILIRESDLEPIIIDFALCKNFDFSQVDPSGLTNLEGDWDLFPSLIDTDPLRIIKERGGKRDELARCALPALDFYQFGKLLSTIAQQVLPKFETRERRYYATIVSHLTDWQRVKAMNPSELVPRVARLSAEHFSPFQVQELGEAGTTSRSITLPPGLSVPTTKMVENVIESRSWRRLTTMRQLSLLGLVYPGADYHRSTHVLLAYDICRRLLLSLFGDVSFRWIFGPEEVRQTLFVALVHDINHFPFLHIFQEMEQRKSRLPGYHSLDLVDLFCDGVLTGEKDNGEPSLYDLAESIGIKRNRLKTILLKKYYEQESDVDCLIKSIIDSGVDVDKLSYLRLDAHFCGVPYGASLDIHALLNYSMICHRGGGQTPHLAFSDGALQALESVVMTRFWHFKSIYWHHTNRAAMAMLLRVVLKVYLDGGANFIDYLKATLWAGDLAALKFIDKAYRDTFHKPSIISELPENRRSLYKRLYTFRAVEDLNGVDDRVLLERLGVLNFKGERSVCSAIALELANWLGSRPEDVSEDDVLIDLPGRKMDSGGDIYVVMSGRNVETLARVSEPIRHVNENYQRLAKRARLFISPKLHREMTSRFGGDFRYSERNRLFSLIDRIVAQHSRESQFV